MSVPPGPGDPWPNPRAQWHQTGHSAQPPPGGDGWWNLFESAAAPPPRKKPSKWPLWLAGAAVVIVAICAVSVWSIVGSRDSSTPDAAKTKTSPAAETTSTTSTTSTTPRAAPRLLNLLPAGVARDRCRAAETAAELRAAIVCRGSGAPGDPTLTTWSEAENQQQLNAAFRQLVDGSDVVVCPGNIQSPGPWRRNASPQTPAGTLLCGFRDGKPIVAWTDVGRLLLVVAEGHASPKALEPLYRWWTTHS